MSMGYLSIAYLVKTYTLEQEVVILGESSPFNLLAT